MLRWFRERRRRKILQRLFPEPWRRTLDSNVPHYAELEPDEQGRLRDFVQVFVAEKSWEGCGGLVLDDEMKVTVAARAGLLTLCRPHDYYRNVQSILIYPSTIVTPERPLGVFEHPRIQPASGIPILGEAHMRGPVLLVWDAVLHNARYPGQGHDVVYHEFAHKLDMLDGAADGTPPFEDEAKLRRWVEVCSEAFLRLRERVASGQSTFLDAYGATNEAEFFAVATEYFFDRPRQMADSEPDLYATLRDFFGQDPAKRGVARGEASGRAVR